jgi:regulator of sirC expression with transglutaminase-like and TPR domain
VTPSNPRERFAELSGRADARLDLAECALLIAAEEYPSLDVGSYLLRLDALAERAGPPIAGADSPMERVELDRRRGIPITLSLVFTEVARRVGIPAWGVGFPGHFLVAVEADGRILVDPFDGRLIDAGVCQRRLEALLGAGAVLDAAVHLRAATPREILVRMLTNLKHVYLRERDFGRALGCCERILLLVPDLPHELRDRGLVYERLECFAAARTDLERFLLLAPDDPTASVVRERIAALHQRTRSLH